MKKYICLFVSFFVLISVVPLQAAQRITFAPGTSSKAVTGTVNGYTTANYMVSARAGQTLDLKLDSKNRFLYFNVLDASENELPGGPPGGTATEWSGTLPKDGDYKVIVFLMRAEARRKGSAFYTLTVTIPK